MLKVMIAEDDLLVADMLQEVLIEEGYDVCGIARTVDEGVALANRHKPDLALLDLRLAAGGLGTEIVARLDRRGGPGILYATGNAVQIVLTTADGDACINKPFRPNELIRALKLVEEIVSTGKATRPFPAGFRLLESTNKPNLFYSNETTLRDIERLRRQQAALAKFGGFALGETDLGKILTEAARVCAESFSIAFCKVCRYRSEQNDLLVEAGVGWAEGVIGTVVSRADRSSPQGRAFITEQPVVCADLTQDGSFLLPSFYAEHGIISTLDVVIKKKDGKPWGILEIDNPEPHLYDDHDINFVTGFANVMAEAVDTSKRNSTAHATFEQMKDILADRNRLVAAQNRLLSEKNILAQELQHRVRNNLHLVYGMLNKQLKNTDEDPKKKGISAIARRVMTLAKVYDHLLGTGLSRNIDFGGYLQSLCENFRDLERTEHQNITLVCTSATFMLDLDTATAVGLIVAELLSNSYLHAFPDVNSAGTINLSVKTSDDGNVATVIFGDDGVGYTQIVDSTRHGLGLVKRLMEQIGGSAEMTSNHGTSWRLAFPIPRTELADPLI